MILMQMSYSFYSLKIYFTVQEIQLLLSKSLILV